MWERDGKFHFRLNLLSRLQKYVELSQELVLTNIRYQEPELCAKFIDHYE